MKKIRGLLGVLLPLLLAGCGLLPPPTHADADAHLYACSHLYPAAYLHATTHEHADADADAHLHADAHLYACSHLYPAPYKHSGTHGDTPADRQAAYARAAHPATGPVRGHPSQPERLCHPQLLPGRHTLRHEHLGLYSQ